MIIFSKLIIHLSSKLKLRQKYNQGTSILTCFDLYLTISEIYLSHVKWRSGFAY